MVSVSLTLRICSSLSLSLLSYSLCSSRFWVISSLLIFLYWRNCSFTSSNSLFSHSLLRRMASLLACASFSKSSLCCSSLLWISVQSSGFFFCILHSLNTYCSFSLIFEAWLILSCSNLFCWTRFICRSSWIWSRVCTACWCFWLNIPWIFFLYSIREASTCFLH